MKASELLPDARNWRRHPDYQRSALSGVLAEIGYADALLARETPEGLVLDVTEEEAGQILATLDPLAAMAQPDNDALINLLGSVRFDSKAVNDMLEALANGETQPMPQSPIEKEAAYITRWEIIVECEGESQQEELYSRLREEGYTCRALKL